MILTASLDALLSRESAVKLAAPAPDDAALDIILRSAVSAPDHGRLRPWRFIIVRDEAKVQRPSKIPDIEQILSAGAAAQNILLATHAQGFGAMWKTGASAYDDFVKSALGLEPS